MSKQAKILIYLLRRDLRLADNPIFNEISRLANQSQAPFTHVLPLYVFPAEQIEISGFLTGDGKSPYPEARSQVGGFWRCGKLRAKFLAESVWDLKQDLRTLNSDLIIRVGSVKDAVESVLAGYRERQDSSVHGLWMTAEDAWEEQKEEQGVKSLLDKENLDFKLYTDEKYFIDDRDLPFKEAKDLSDVFTTFRKTVEPLRDAPRKQLPRPEKLLPLPDHIPPQAKSFEIPDSLDGVIDALQKPLDLETLLPEPPKLPSKAESAHPFLGGSKTGHERVRQLIDSGAMSSYKDTRNGLLGLDFSTKLSAWLALGSLTARQVHWALVDYEDGKGETGRKTDGYGKGENKGTAAVRFELLWRDYMRLCTRKFDSRLFFVEGYRGDQEAKFKFISSPFTESTEKKNKKGVNDEDTRRAVERFFSGRTGIGLIDASQRELFTTGWTSNRARQNVASFLTKHLGIDWRLGAEWYETNLIDYDVSSNWGNWQYVAGVGNDPRGQARVFNPVKQAVDYDPDGKYVRAWVEELRDVGGDTTDTQKGVQDGVSLEESLNLMSLQDKPDYLMGVFQAWKLPDSEKKRLNLNGIDWVEKPLVRIEFSLNRRGGGAKRGGRGGSSSRGRGGRGRGRGRGGPNKAE